MVKVQKRWANRQWLLISLWLTLLVLAVKVWVGWATQSLSLISESLHTLLAVFSTLLSMMAAARASGGREVWGHTKLEACLTLLLAALMGFACLSLLALAGQQLSAIAQNTVSFNALTARPAAPVVLMPLLQLLGVVMATMFCLACFKLYEAGMLNNAALRFNASCLFLDVWLTLVVIIGLFGVLQGYVWIDPVLAIFMVLSAIALCCRVINRQLPLLIRQIAIAPEAIAQTIHQIEGITHCYDIQTRGVVGRQIFVEMRLILHPECTSLARTIAERVERLIRDRYGPARVVIYIDGDLAQSRKK